MWIESKIVKEDLDNIIKDSAIPWSDLDGARILVTGATGLIGSSIVNALLYYGLHAKESPMVYVMARNRTKANEIFSQQLKQCGERLQLVIGDIKDHIDINGAIDFIIHCASQTASRLFVNEPVETLDTSILGTKNILEFAKDRRVKGVVYLSSMEVYGSPTKGSYVTEDAVAGFDPRNIRNCYPISKIVCESLCNSYCKEYSVPVKTVRLTQTMGPGVSWHDKRVFAEFAKCALEGKDIVLKTKGETERMYLYTGDAVRAVLTVLLLGNNGEVYTAANEETYCSIADMADIVRRTLANGSIDVRYELQDASKLGYAGTLFMRLNTQALQHLGWKPYVGLNEMYRRMAATMRENDLSN